MASPLCSLQQVLAAITLVGALIGYVLPLTWANLVALPAASLMMTISYLGGNSGRLARPSSKPVFCLVLDSFLGAALLEVGLLLGGLDVGIDTSVAMMVGLHCS